MIRHLRRYLAIRSYMHKLSSEMMHRFGIQYYYSIENVTYAVQRSHLSSAFIAYARAAYCSEEEFDAHYQPLKVACTYHGLRQTIARRYLDGQPDFNGKTVILRFCRISYISDHFIQNSDC